MKKFQHVDVATLDLLQHHALQVEYAIVSQTLMAPNVHIVSLGFMDFLIAKVKIENMLTIYFYKKVFWDILKYFQHVNVATLDLLRHHAIQVEYALVSLMSMVPNVQIVSLAFMDFPTAKVKIKPLKN